MQPEEVLLAFLRGTLGPKRDRILDFAARPNARRKFMDLLYHQLGDLFDEACVVLSLPDNAWQQQALRFRPPDDFGVAVPTLRSAFHDGELGDLVITTDARYGFWRDETYVDVHCFLALRPERRRARAPSG